MLATEAAFKSLPVSAQITAHNLADQLRSISGHLAGAANYGAATAHRLSGIAHGKVAEIDDAAPASEKSIDVLKSIAVLTRMANEASDIGLNLLKANKDTIDNLNKRQDEDDLNLGATSQNCGVGSRDFLPLLWPAGH